jgi:hypothetical protein
MLGFREGVSESRWYPPRGNADYKGIRSADAATFVRSFLVLQLPQSGREFASVGKNESSAGVCWQECRNQDIRCAL